MTMVERVARALCAAEMADPDAITIHQLPQWKIWEEHARAAIEAMREPSDAMLVAAHKAWFQGSDANWKGQHTDPAIVRPYFVETFRAQIDAALTEDERAPDPRRT